MEKIGAIYLRVSTEEQNPENQIADVRKLAEALKYKIVEVYVDKESGGYAERKEFQRMMADAEAGKFQTLFIWALDRFSREGIEMTLSHIKRLKEAGVVLKSYQESWLDTSIEGISELLIAVLSYAAKEELKRFRERSMAGKKTRLANNKMIGCYPPYGYTHIKRDKERGIDARFEINPEEALIVKKIFSLYLELESIFMVAKRLAEMKIKSRGKGTKPKFFHSSTVKKILNNEAYIGNWYYGKSSPCVAKFHIKKERKHKLTGRRINPKSEWKLIKIPAIIEEKTFNRVQQIMKNRYRQKGTEPKLLALCKGLIRCVSCGRLYGARLYKYSKKSLRGERQYFMYRCPQIHGLDFNEPPCRSRSIMVHRLDEAVWEYVSALIRDKERVKASIRLLKDKREKDKSSNKNILNTLLTEKEKLRAKISKLLELYGDSNLSKEDLSAKIDEVKERESVLDSQIAGVQKELKEIENMEAIEEEVEKLCVLYQNNISNASFEQKRYIVKKWVKEIRLLKDRRIIMKVNLPEMPVLAEPMVLNKNILSTKSQKAKIGGRRLMVNSFSPKEGFQVRILASPQTYAQ